MYVVWKKRGRNLEKLAKQQIGDKTNSEVCSGYSYCLNNNYYSNNHFHPKSGKNEGKL
jgi:hypothetical protein